jgi:hypothetical protein
VPNDFGKCVRVSDLCDQYDARRRPRSMLSLHPNSLSSRKWSLPSNWKAKPMPTQKILGWRQFLPWSERILWNFQQRDWNLHIMHF